MCSLGVPALLRPHVSKVQEIFLYISPMPFHTLFRSHVNTYQSYVNVEQETRGDFDRCLFTPVSTVFLSVISGVERRCSTVLTRQLQQTTTNKQKKVDS